VRSVLTDYREHDTGRAEVDLRARVRSVEFGPVVEVVVRLRFKYENGPNQPRNDDSNPNRRLQTFFRAGEGRRRSCQGFRYIGVSSQQHD
jgi:hypothetical protein